MASSRSAVSTRRLEPEAGRAASISVNGLIEDPVACPTIEMQRVVGAVAKR